MKILSSPPPLPDREVTCSRCKAVLAVTNADVDSVEHRDGIHTEPSYHAWHGGKTEVFYRTQAGYVYSLDCAVCRKRLSVVANLYGSVTVEFSHTF